VSDTRSKNRDRWLAYLGERTGTLEYRFLRYAVVADELERLGLREQSLLADIGAGSCDFDFYLRTVRGFRGRYLPIDGSIDGTNLETWRPSCDLDLACAIEVLEHLKHPAVLVRRILRKCRFLVVTTPNKDQLGPEAVMAMDTTHLTPLGHDDLQYMGATRIRACSFFGRFQDTLLAAWET
jgi:hypothetical protein